ncbi:MAG: SpaH/EbpB family LPXTG-anchored major pilin [Scrofimicrobium sp.]
MTKQKIGRRFAAGAGALALAMAGVLATSSAAFAAQGTDGTPPDNAPSGTTGTLVVHKHAGTTTTNPNNGTSQTIARPPLANVGFTVCKVGDLTTNAQWAAVATANVNDYTCTTETPGATTLWTLADGSATFEGLSIGLYKVVETDPPAGVDTPALPFLVTIPFPSKSTDTPAVTTWLWTVHAYPKNTLDDEGDKTVADPGTHGLGAIVPWEITTRPLGSFDGGAPLTSYVIKDVLNANLQYNSTLSLKYIVPGATAVDVPAAHYTVAPSAPATTGGGTATVTFNPGGVAWLNGLQAGTKLVWQLDTKVVGVGVLDNKAFENTGGDDVKTGEATTDWGAAKLLKHEAGNPAKTLANAEFKVFDLPASGTCAPAVADAGTPITILDNSVSPAVTRDVFTSTAQGVVNIPGLYVGKDGAPVTRDYCVYETKAPNGYTASTAPIKITVTPGAVADGTWSAQVPNTPTEGPNLPLTGAQGTMAMSIGGLLLVAAGAGVMVYNRRRRNS